MSSIFDVPSDPDDAPSYPVPTVKFTERQWGKVTYVFCSCCYGHPAHTATAGFAYSGWCGWVRS